MKKKTIFSLILCLALLLSCAMPVVYAAQDDDSNEEQLPPSQSEVSFGSLSTTNGCRTINGTIPLGGSDQMLDTAQAAFIYERNTETVIYGYNPDAHLAPGSLLKILTAMIALEQCELSEKVTVDTASISKLPYGAINAKLKNGEVITMEDALHFMILTSANDAALMIAEHISGSEAEFVKLMNQRAKELGCTNTNLLNCHGLDRDGQYTSARDMAKIVMEATKDEDFRNLFKSKEYVVAPTNKVDEKRTINTGNHLIFARILPQFVDSRVTGGMPSYSSEETGAALAFTAEDEGMSLVYVIMGATRTFGNNGNAKYYGNFEEALDMLAYSFDNFHITELYYNGLSLNQFPVSNGESEVVGQTTKSHKAVLPAKVHMKDLRFEHHPLGGGLRAPIEAGDKIATVDIWYKASCVTQVELFAMNPVRQRDETGVEIRGGGQGPSVLGSILSVLGVILVIAVVGFAAYLGYNHFRRYLRRTRRRRRRASRRRSR